MYAAGIIINVTVCDKHVPEIERYIRTVKERVRKMVKTPSFKKIPPLTDFGNSIRSSVMV